jgi:hypothetical protein
MDKYVGWPYMPTLGIFFNAAAVLDQFIGNSFLSWMILVLIADILATLLFFQYSKMTYFTSEIHILYFTFPLIVLAGSLGYVDGFISLLFLLLWLNIRANNSEIKKTNYLTGALVCALLLTKPQVFLSICFVILIYLIAGIKNKKLRIKDSKTFVVGFGLTLMLESFWASSNSGIKQNIFQQIYEGLSWMILRVIFDLNSIQASIRALPTGNGNGILETLSFFKTNFDNQIPNYTVRFDQTTLNILSGICFLSMLIFFKLVLKIPDSKFDFNLLAIAVVTYASLIWVTFGVGSHENHVIPFVSTILIFIYRIKHLKYLRLFLYVWLYSISVNLFLHYSPALMNFDFGSYYNENWKYFLFVNNLIAVVSACLSICYILKNINNLKSTTKHRIGKN